MRGCAQCYNDPQGLSPDADINSEDNDMVAKGEELLDLALNAVADMKGEYLVGVLYSALKKYPGPCSAAARKNVVAALKVRLNLKQNRSCTLARACCGRQLTELPICGGCALLLLLLHRCDCIRTCT